MGPTLRQCSQNPRITYHEFKGRRKADTINRNDVTLNRGHRSHFFHDSPHEHENELTQTRVRGQSKAYLSDSAAKIKEYARSFLCVDNLNAKDSATTLHTWTWIVAGRQDTSKFYSPLSVLYHTLL